MTKQNPDMSGLAAGQSPAMEHPPEPGCAAGVSAGKHIWGLLRRHWLQLLCLLFFGLVFWVFYPSLHGDFIEFDDFDYVTGNQHLAFTLANLLLPVREGAAANWHPLTMWSLMLDHRLYGLNPWGYHLTNLLLHSANTVLLFLVLRRLSGSLWRSLMVAALFGLHPLRVESVVWISERKDVLSVLFWMLTLWAYARYAQGVTRASPAVAPAPIPSGVMCRPSFFYGLALSFFFLGLMSKPMLVTLPFVLLLLDYWPLARWARPNRLRLVLEKAPFFLLTAILCVVTYIVQKNGGVMKDLAGLSFSERLENALVSYGRYLGKLFWPVDLCALYPHPGHWPAERVCFAGLLLLVLSAAVVVLRRRYPYGWTGWFWYLGTLVPVIGLVQVGSESMSDRYSYIPSIGILIVVVWGGHQLTKGWPFQRIGSGIIGGSLILACIGLTRHQIGFWTDTATVCRRAIAVTENNYDAHSRLGRALFSQGHVDEAIGEFQAALKARPDYVEAWCSLGRSYAVKGQADEAMAYYQKALEIQPNSVVAHNNLSDLLYHRGRLDEAVVHAQKALAIEPDNVTALNNLGSAFTLEGRLDEAQAALQRAAELQPDNAAVQINLGSLLLRRGRMDEVIVHSQRALVIESNNVMALNNLGYALYSLGRFDDAIQAYQTVVRLRPGEADAHRSLGYALFQRHRLDEAIREFREALRLKPDDVALSNDLAAAVALKERVAVPPSKPTKP